MTELVVTQQVPAPPDQVYAAWTSAEGLARWWWPHWEDTIYQVDAVEGGAWRAFSPSNGIGVHGRFVRLQEPDLIELTWVWEDDDEAQDHVRVELTEHDAGTLVTVRHRTTEAGVDDYRQGWEFVLGNLAIAVAPPHPLRQRFEALAGPVVTAEQLVAAPPGQVYRAWLSPERLATWWWPELRDTTYEIDARVGGRFRFRSEQLQHGAHGTVLGLTPDPPTTGDDDDPAVLVLSWIWESGGHDSPEDMVWITFDPVGDATHLRLDHRLAGPTDDTSALEQGWVDVLGRLGRPNT